MELVYTIAYTALWLVGLLFVLSLGLAMAAFWRMLQEEDDE